MGCCMGDNCRQSAQYEGNFTLAKYCKKVAQVDIPDLTGCKTTSAIASPEATSPSESAPVPASAPESRTMAATDLETSQPIKDSEGQDTEKDKDDNSDVVSSVGLGVGFGVGIPCTAAALGFLSFAIWRRRSRMHQNRGKEQGDLGLPAYRPRRLSLFKIPKAPVELEAPRGNPHLGVIHELPPECRPTELPG